MLANKCYSLTFFFVFLQIIGESPKKQEHSRHGEDSRRSSRSGQDKGVKLPLDNNTIFSPAYSSHKTSCHDGHSASVHSGMF